MGFGDIISWSIYEVANNLQQLYVANPLVLVYKESSGNSKIIALRNLPGAFMATLRNMNIHILPLKLKLILSSTRPPYWVKKEFVLAPFSEFLAKLP